MTEGDTAQPIIVFDGLCILCSVNAQMILRWDRRQVFRLAAMQNEAGAALLRANGLDPADPETLIVVACDRVLRNSDAVLFIYRRLGWPWRATAALGIIPRPLRDAAYRLMARNRYHWFGKREVCWAPNADDRHRML